MLSHANLDKDFWVKAATTALYLINRSPHRSLDGNIPEILWSGNSVDYSNLRVFGCPVYVHLNEGKLVPSAVKCIFLGYSFRVKGYRVWCLDPKYRQIIHSRDVTFNEDVITNFAHIKNYEPTNYLKAISSPECDKWDVAMEEEVESLHKNKTLELVKLPKDKRVISCKWLFKVKDVIPGVESNWYKAWYVVREFDQCESIDFNEVFSAVVRHTTIRVLFSIVALQDLEPEQLDVKTSFLHGHLEEEIYVEQPEGFKVPRNEDHVDQKMGKLTLLHTDYISKVLKKFNMSSYKPFPTSLALNFKLSFYECPKSEKDKEDMSRVPYSSVVGSLMYTMFCTPPDLAHAVSVVSRYMHNPGKMHWEVVKCILRYLKGTGNIGLSFEKGRASPNGVVGYLVFILQAITALSTIEAEYIASTEGVKEAIWLRGMTSLVLLVFDTLRGATTTTMKSYGFWFKVKIVGIVSQKL
nr:hypothetical protein [Tanacetum cinerariifolium]